MTCGIDRQKDLSPVQNVTANINFIIKLYVSLVVSYFSFYEFLVLLM